MSVLWHLNGTLLADLHVRDVHIDEAINSPGQLTAIVDGRAADLAPLFAYGTTVVLTRQEDDADPVRWFVGVSVRPDAALQATSENQFITLAGPLWWLDQFTYAQLRAVYIGVGLTTALDPDVLLCSLIDGTLVQTGAAITDAINYAITCGADLQLGTIDAGTYAPADRANSVSCGEVIRRLLRLTPDVSLYVDHTTTPPTVHTKKRSALTAVNVPLTPPAGATWKNTGFRCRRCDDIEYSGVYLVYKKTISTDTGSFILHAYDVAPGGANPQSAGCLVTSIDLRGGTYSWLRQDVTTATLPAVTDTGFWTTFHPKLGLSGVSGLAISNASRTSSLPRRLTGGQIAAWMLEGSDAIAAEDDVWACDAEYTYTAADGSVSKAKEHLVAKIIATDATTKTYKQLGNDYDPGEAVPSGLAAAMLAALSAAQYEGEYQRTEPDCAGAIGLANTLNLTGSANAEWDTMTAHIVRRHQFIDQGETTISFGPPAHLSAGDYIEALRSLRDRRAGSAYERSTGRTAGTGELQLANTGRLENSIPAPLIASRWKAVGTAGAEFDLNLDDVPAVAAKFREIDELVRVEWADPILRYVTRKRRVLCTDYTAAEVNHTIDTAAACT